MKKPAKKHLDGGAYRTWGSATNLPRILRRSPSMNPSMNSGGASGQVSRIHTKEEGKSVQFVQLVLSPIEGFVAKKLRAQAVICASPNW